MGKSLSITRGDTVLVWLKILTIFLGLGGTIAVVFLADVMTARLANPTSVAGVEAVTMSEVEELHHWIGYKVALQAKDDKDCRLSRSKDICTGYRPQAEVGPGRYSGGTYAVRTLHPHQEHPQGAPGDKSGASGVSSTTGGKAGASPDKRKQDGRYQSSGGAMVTVTSGHAKEEAQETLEALLRGNVEAAEQLLTHQSGSDGHQELQ